jgi:hypothetical protein
VAFIEVLLKDWITGSIGAVSDAHAKAPHEKTPIRYLEKTRTGRSEFGSTTAEHFTP